MADIDARIQAVRETYAAVQTLQFQDRLTDRAGLARLSDTWRDAGTPALQRRVADRMLANLAAGVVDPVFEPAIDALTALPPERFSLLDAGCASGYYGEVIRSCVPKDVRYRGCDFSRAMIERAHAHHPGLRFDVGDLRCLAYADESFDVVLLSGVIEHVPAFETAVAQVCRVCSAYVVLHRCPFTSSSEHEYTAGSQYNIETARIYFARHLLIGEFARHGFSLDREVRRSILLGQGDAPLRRVATLVFRRR